MIGKKYVSNIWCGKHTYFDENGYPMKNFPYIDPKIKNTGIGSFSLWCGEHTYFDNDGNKIKIIPYIDPKIKNTGIGSYNLWCGNHTYFSDVDDYQMYTEEKDITIIDLETNKEYKTTQKKTYPIYNIID